MTEPSAVGRKAAPWGLLGMLCLVLVAEWAVSRRGFHVLDADDWNFVRKGHVAGHEARNYDVLFFGDSLTSFGVVPRAVTARSGRKTYNLAISGSQAPASYFLLRRVLDSGARPEAVVVDFHPPLLLVGPRRNLTRWASLLSVAESATLAWWSRDANLFGAVVVRRLLPSVRGREGLRENLMAAFGGRGDWRSVMNAVMFRNWARNDGAHMTKPGTGFQSLTDAEYERYRDANFPGNGFDRANVKGIQRFLALAAEHGVTVYWLLPPFVPRFQASLVRSGFDAKHAAFLRSWQARFPNLIVVDGRNAVDDPGPYHDQCHLAAPGAYAFSLALGDVLRHTLPMQGAGDGRPTTRWVTVPACKVGVVAAEVETTDQTVQAIEAGWKVRR